MEEVELSFPLILLFVCAFSRAQFVIVKADYGKFMEDLLLGHKRYLLFDFIHEGRDILLFFPRFLSERS